MVDLNKVATSKTTFNKNKVLRKRLIVLDVSAMEYGAKKKLIETQLLKTFGEIPSGVSFDIRFTKKSKHNPDGKRIFIRCDWIKRNRFHDMDGKFHYGTLIKAIKKRLLGTIKPQILSDNTQTAT